MSSRFLSLPVLYYVLFMHISLVQLLALNPETGNVTVKCIERERQALLSLKRGFQLKYDWLPSWGDGKNHKECCNWEGIQCSNETGHVLKLDLSYIYFYVTQSIPDVIGSLTHLRHLNLGWCGFQGKIPHELGNLLFLEHLDLSENNFTGTIPLHFGNLSNLQYLDLGSHYPPSYLSSDLQWVSHLSSLRHLSLRGANLSSANNWQRQVSGLSHLQYLDFHACDLLDSISPSLSSAANFSTSLSFVDISDNYLMNSSLIFPWLMNSTRSLSVLRMNDNSLKGTIPEAFVDLSSLQELNLANNMLNGQVPVSWFHSCNLKELNLSNNRLTGEFHEFVQAFSRCAHKSLQILDMGWNEITGMVPDLSQLSSLQGLRLDNNGLNGTIHESIGQLSNLIELSLANNKLEGLISEAHFSRLSNLSTLDLSHNALVFNVSSAWVPPFKLIGINLASCNLGPDFPRWLQTQKHISRLDISQNEISSNVPNWFWKLLSTVVELNLAHNHIRGKIENLSVPFYPFQRLLQIDLSSNLFEGPIPAFLSSATQLFLSNNTFSSVDLLLCANTSKRIRFLDLSHNNLRGELLECWMDFEKLITLDLSDNYLDGNLPKSMGSLQNIRSLHLGGNRFSGEIPLSLINCTKLEVFVAAQNHLSGLLPSWIGDKIPRLLILSLHSNKFYGSIPLSICNLSELRVLDLSQNKLSENIPKCMRNLSAMASKENSNATISHYYNSGCDVNLRFCDPDSGVYNDSTSLIWKGKMSKYGSTLGLLRSIDLSSNRLIGEIPSEITTLVGLVSFNISRNMLSGVIPPTIGQLSLLDFLDMSRNQLSGRIPPQLSQLDFLSVLDLSYNDLSGEIPLGTQLQTRDASAYTGNPKLCGAPLNKTCPIHGHQINENDAHVDEQLFTKGFYIAMAIGFVVGFWGVCLSLILKTSWRYAYFKFLSDVYDKLYVLTAVTIAKLRRLRS